MKSFFFQWNAVFMTMRFVLSSQGMPGDRGYRGVTGITGEKVSLCLSVVQSCATMYSAVSLWLKLPNLQKKIVGYFKCN